MSKNIVLLIDGTQNDSRVRCHHYKTNVCQLSDMAQRSAFQCVKYLDGVGTDRFHDDDDDPRQRRRSVAEKLRGFARKLVNNRPKPATSILGSVYGYGTEFRIKCAYHFLCKNFKKEEDDSIYLFGFSRGAFAVRSLAGFVGRIGLLLSNEATLEHVEKAYDLYVNRDDPDASEMRAFLQKVGVNDRPGDEDPLPLPIHFIGVWDTVGALGPRWERLTPYSDSFIEHHDLELPKHITHARHALAVHELRTLFEPTIWTQAAYPGQSLKQRWFPGAHADVGGGYEPPNWSDLALTWMIAEAAEVTKLGAPDLKLYAPQHKDFANRASGFDESTIINHQIKKWFRWNIPTPRSLMATPCTVPQTVKTFEVDPSVRRRWF